ncbi:MAG: SH3 domain-containing protein [Anaerolineae bacterium]|nr:SH3 domain-containing protein [Anaerolineae bacterium]
MAQLSGGLHQVFASIPEGTPLTLIGRNINGEWYKTSYDGWEGWVWYGHLHFDGEPYRLDIISLHEGISGE